MRLLYTLFSIIFCITLVSTPIQAQDTGWLINEFRSEIKVEQKGSVVVEETIMVDFNNLSKHGIYRSIPVDYKDRFGNRLNIRLKLEKVNDEKGQDRPYTLRRKGKTVEIKIGDPDRIVTGKQTYVVKYTVERVITRFSDHDELYWNATGHDWPVPIETAVAKVILPEKATDATCFTGVSGSSLQQCLVGVLGATVEFKSKIVLNPAAGLTIVVGIPKGTVEEPKLSTRLLWLVSDNWPYAIPLLTLTVLVWLYWIQGRDEHYKSLFDPSLGVRRLPLFPAELIPSTYAPLKDLRPAEAGTLIDEEINIRDIAATVVDLAVRGYLRIEEVSKSGMLKAADYRLIWVNKDTSKLEDYESMLLLALFGKSKAGDSVLLSELKFHFTSHLSKIRDSLHEHLTKNGLFPRRPDKVIGFYRVIGFIIVFLGLAAFSQSLAWGLALLVSGILILIFSKAMPRKTAKGRKEYLRVLGLRNFISLGAYREQLWEKANLFEEVLPYAIAFNLTHKLAAAFAKINVSPPNWYKGSGPFNLNSFAYAMEDFTKQTTTTLPATRSASSGGSGFGGGGFGGGGFGGGGGGSW